MRRQMLMWCAVCITLVLSAGPFAQDDKKGPKVPPAPDPKTAPPVPKTVPPAPDPKTAPPVPKTVPPVPTKVPPAPDPKTAPPAPDSKKK